MASEAVSPQIAVDVNALTRTYGKKKALDCVSLSIPQGIVYGLIGENGAGKTTLIKHLLGLLKAQSGLVRVLGKDPVDDPVGVLSKIGYLPEESDLPDWMSLTELVRYTSSFYSDWDFDYFEKARLHLKIDYSHKIKNLSKGQKVRVALMLALAHRPDILLLDEPSSGLDPIVRHDLMTSIIPKAKRDGRTVIFSSHVLSEVETVCDQVAMLQNGRIVFNEKVSALTQLNMVDIVFAFDEIDRLRKLEGVLTVESREGGICRLLYSGDSESMGDLANTNAFTVTSFAKASVNDVFIAYSASNAVKAEW